LFQYFVKKSIRVPFPKSTQVFAVNTINVLATPIGKATTVRNALAPMPNHGVMRRTATTRLIIIPNVLPKEFAIAKPANANVLMDTRAMLAVV
jgi:hypothetical protein